MMKKEMKKNIFDTTTNDKRNTNEKEEKINLNNSFEEDFDEEEDEKKSFRSTEKTIDDEGLIQQDKALCDSSLNDIFMIEDNHSNDVSMTEESISSEQESSLKDGNKLTSHIDNIVREDDDHTLTEELITNEQNEPNMKDVDKLKLFTDTLSL